MPDSIVFWAKFVPNGHNQNARMKASLHTTYNYRDPEDAASANELVASAVENFANQNKKLLLVFFIELLFILSDDNFTMISLLFKP